MDLISMSLNFVLVRVKKNLKKPFWAIQIDYSNDIWNIRVNAPEKFIDPHNNKKLIYNGKFCYKFPNKTKAEEVIFQCIMRFS